MDTTRSHKPKCFLVWVNNVTSVKDKPIQPEEIIQITAKLIQTEDLQHVVDQKQEFVKPSCKPKLSPYCIKSTGVCVSQV